MSDTTRKLIGHITIPAGRENTRHYECAAWYTRTRTMSDQTVPVYLVGNYWVCYSWDAIVQEDNFQSLYGGVAVGRAYDRAQNAGKRTQASAQLNAASFAQMADQGVASIRLAEGVTIAQVGNYSDGRPMLGIRVDGAEKVYL